MEFQKEFFRQNTNIQIPPSPRITEASYGTKCRTKVHSSRTFFPSQYLSIILGIVACVTSCLFFMRVSHTCTYQDLQQRVFITWHPLQFLYRALNRSYQLVLHQFDHHQ